MQNKTLFITSWLECNINKVKNKHDQFIKIKAMELILFAGSAVAGVAIAETVGGMGLAVAGTAIAIEAAPVIVTGAIVGLAAYGIKSALFDW